VDAALVERLALEGDGARDGLPSHRVAAATDQQDSAEAHPRDTPGELTHDAHSTGHHF